MKLSKNSYFMWRAYTPFICAHNSVVDTLRVEPDQESVTLPEIDPPLEVHVAEPETASASSGGLVTSVKLQGDLERIRRDANKALTEIRGCIPELKHKKYPKALFPELEEEILTEKASTILAQREEIESALNLHREQR